MGLFKKRSFGKKKRAYPARWNLQIAQGRPASQRPKPTWITNNPRPAKDRPKGWFF